ncbi:MAG: hypothetical protein ACI8PT_003821 [Gammaproteobacteria bacterium]|jgi:hypothetical protein
MGWSLQVDVWQGKSGRVNLAGHTSNTTGFGGVSGIVETVLEAIIASEHGAARIDGHQSLLVTTQRTGDRR